MEYIYPYLSKLKTNNYIYKNAESKSSQSILHLMIDYKNELNNEDQDTYSDKPKPIFIGYKLN